jgi:hypothetical protein
MRRRFPATAQLPQLPPCRVQGDPVDHMPIAPGRPGTDRMPVAGKSCADTVLSPADRSRP